MAKKGFVNNLTNKALPAAVGGAGAKLVNKFLTPMIEGVLPDAVKPAAQLTPAIVGVLMMDGDEMMQFARAGMIGSSIGDTAAAAMPEMFGIGDDVLADALDDLFDGVNDDDDDDDDE